MRRGLAILLWGGVLCGQSLRVYSEFQRVDPLGRIAASDAGEGPREVLSPLAPRNAWVSFHAAVTVPEGVPSFVWVLQNPELFRVEVYRELFVKTAAGWIPDRLEPVKMPYFLNLPQTESAAIPGQTTVPLWVDVWVPRAAPPGRMRLEVVLKYGSEWIRYPMEVRVSTAVVPDRVRPQGMLPAADARADAPLVLALRQAWCGAKPGVPAGGATVRSRIKRNASQDLALARGAQPLEAEFRLRVAAAAGGDICAAPLPRGAEWYLGARRRLYEAAAQR